MRKLLFAIKCSSCNNEFVYCFKSGRDFRCYKCKNGNIEDIEQELANMSKEERTSFMEDIIEYEKEHGKIEEDDELQKKG